MQVRSGGGQASPYDNPFGGNNNQNQQRQSNNQNQGYTRVDEDPFAQRWSNRYF